MSYLTYEYGQGYSASAPTEWYCGIGTRRGMSKQLRCLIYAHGSGDTTFTATSAAKAGQNALLRTLAQDYFILVADLGLQAGWGNDLHRQRIEDAVSFLSTRWGFNNDQVTLMGGSMGVLGIMQYARVNPTRVRNMVGIIPALDLQSLMSSASADINAAYGGAYNDATHGPLHSPVQFADELDEDIPITLFTASNDTITLPSTATAFVSARPRTKRVDLGAVGHTEAAVTASITGVRSALKYLKDVPNV